MNSFRAPSTVLLTSDWHLGAIGSDTALIRREIAAHESFALIGDVFDAIAPGDKRYDSDMVDPRCLNSNPLGSALDIAREIILPYRDRCLFISSGNHERYAQRLYHVDLIAELSKSLNIPYLPYAGVVKINDVRLGYWHGHGHGVNVLRQSQQLLAAYEGVDIVWTGHRHQRVVSTCCRIRSSRLRRIWLAQSGAYLNWIGYPMERMLAPSDKGGLTCELNPLRISIC